jgi:hypothetical protein
MACVKSTTSDDEGEPGADIGARLRQHEALTRETYGRSLEEILTIAIERGWHMGFSAGHEAGYRRGHADAYLAAKGGKKSSRIPAKTVIALTVGELGWRPADERFMATAIEVLSCIAGGEAEWSRKSVPEDVTKFLKAPRSYPWPKGWPKQKTLLEAYSRQRAKRRRELNTAAGEEGKMSCRG